MQRSSAQPRPLPPLPQGLKVLLVSTDDVIHNCIKNQLSHPHYQISIFPTCTSALRLLASDNIDLVLSDFSLKDIDGYEFIDQVQHLKKNIPHVVIFEAERLVHEVTWAFKLGACYILRKPLSEASDEIRNLWQHVFRRRVQFEPLNHQNEGSSSHVSQEESLERGNQFMNHGEEPSLKKRPRFVWTDERHAKFVEAVEQLGKDAVPTKILQAMNEPGLTRENVGSHLQKYRENKKKREREETQLHERHMNNANGRNGSGINNHILAPPVVSSSSYPDMSHLHLLETSTTNSSSPPPRPQMQRHHYNHEHLACQQQIQYEHHHLNFGVTHLMGNGVNNLTSLMQQPSHSSYGRRMHQPDSNMLQNSGLGSPPHGTNQSQSNQNQASCVSSHDTTNMLLHQLEDQNSCQVSCFSSHGTTTIRGANQNQSNQNQGVGIVMQQLDQNPSSGSGMVVQLQPITHQLDQEDNFDVDEFLATHHFDQEDIFDVHGFDVDGFDVDELFAIHSGG